MLVLRDSISAVTVDADINKFEIVRQAAEVSTAAFNNTPGVWDSLLLTIFVSKLELLREFFSLCKNVSLSFKCENFGQSMPTGDVIIRPVKKFVGEFVQLMILGTGPKHLSGAITQAARDSNEQPVNRYFEVNKGKSKLEIEELWQSSFDDKIASGALNQARIAKSGVLIKNLTTQIQKWELTQQLDKSLEIMTSMQQINALQHAGVQWFYEELIPREANLKLAEPIR